MAVRKSSYYNNGKKPIKRVYAVRHCSYYSEKRHNSCTYIVEIKDTDNSNTFKKQYFITKLIIFYCCVKKFKYISSYQRFDFAQWGISLGGETHY